MMVTIKFEADPVLDAAELIMRIREALRSRHGDAFRALERRIEALPGAAAKIDLKSLDATTMIATPPQEWTDLISEAVRLGVI